MQREPKPALANKRTDWQSFKISLEAKIQLAVHLRNEEQIDAEVEKFNRDIQSAVWENTPEITIQRKGNIKVVFA